MLALAALLLSISAGPADALVDRVLAAYGGAPALRRMPCRSERGTITSLLHPGQTGTIVRILGRDGALRVETRFPGSEGEVRVLHRGRGVRNGVDVTGSPPHAAMWLQAIRLSLPLALDEARAHLVDLGTVEVGGSKLHVLHLPLEGGAVLEIVVDPGSARIIRSSGTLPGPMQLQFTTEYHDFRRVKGILVPFREANYAQGQRTGDTRLEEVKVLSAPPPHAFDEAGGGPPRGTKL